MGFWSGKPVGSQTYKKVTVKDSSGNFVKRRLPVPQKLEGGLRERASNTLNIGWQAGSVLSSISELTDKWLPQVEIVVSVKLWGSAQSNMSNLYYLASALASNANPDTLRGFRGHMFAASILPHAKFVQVNIAMTSGGMLGSSGLFAAGSNVPTTGRELIRAPIQDEFKADKTWPFFMSDDIRDGKSAQPLGTVPTILGQTNPVIATTLAASNPYPAMDGVSRQSDLTELLTAALIGSCDPVPCPQTSEYRPSPSGAANRAPSASATPRNGFLDLVVGFAFGATVAFAKPAEIRLTSLAESGEGAQAVPQKC